MRRKRTTDSQTGKSKPSTEMEMLAGLTEWRQQHPKATFREIEEAVNERLDHLRAAWLSDLVSRSEQADWSQVPKEERPTCERCAQPLVSRGKRTRRLSGPGGKQVEVTRLYGTCPQCGQGFFPSGQATGTEPE